MSDDFLKKIKKAEQTKDNNPFNKIFKEKQDSIKNNVNKIPKKEKEGIDGIENLGKTGTPRADAFEDEEMTKDIDNELPAKNIQDENILDNFNNSEHESVNSIPTKDMSKSDIFKDRSGMSEDNLSFRTSSSYKNLDLESSSNISSFNDKTINEIIILLKNNKYEDAIKLIKDTVNA